MTSKLKLLLLCVGLAGATGCDGDKMKNGAPAVSQSFEQEPPEVRADVDAALRLIQTGHYVEGLLKIRQVAHRKPLSAEQQRVVANAIGQVQAAVEANPRLETPELHRAMQAASESLRSRSRF